MANPNEFLVFGIKFDPTDSYEKIGKLTQEISKSKKEQDELQKKIKEGNELSKEEAVRLGEVQKEIRALNEERRKEEKIITNLNRMHTAEAGSIDELRAQLSILTAEWNSLSEEERNNVQIGGSLQKQTKATSDKLKELEGTVGDNRRSVGSYTKGILDAIPGLGGMANGVKNVSTALMASPMGVFSAALQILPQLLNSSGEGADFFAKAMSIMNAIIQEGLKRLVALGGAAVKLMTGDFKGAFAEGKGALTGFTDAVNSAVKSGGALADRLDALENAESRFTVTQAKVKKQIDELLIQAGNRTTSEAKRIQLLEKAEKLEVQINSRALKLARERLALIEEENRQKQSDEDEEIKRVNEQQARIIELEAESSKIQEKIQRRKDQLADVAADRAAKRREKEADQEAKRAQMELERLEDIEKKKQTALAETARFLNELAAIDKKIADDKAELEADLLSIDIENSRNKKAREEKELQDKIARKQAEYDANLNFLSATQNLMAVIAEENSALADFEKALTLFRIGLASGEALVKGIKSSQDLPFPGNLIAMGTTIATVTASLLQAKTLIDPQTPKAPKTKAFADGGLEDHRAQIANGSTIRVWAEPETGGEAYIPLAPHKRQRSLSIWKETGRRLGVPVVPFADGGLLRQSVSIPMMQNQQISQMVTHNIQVAISKMPAPIVSVTDINQVQSNVNQTQVKTTI